jgi:formylglycine-generating enzyme required for sulfatase activity
VRHPHLGNSVTRQQLLDWFRQGRARSEAIFAIPKPEAYYTRPIELRNPIVFYEGHLPAFAINTLIKLALQRDGIDAHYESLFERGIDPEDATSAKSPTDLWPSRDDVRAYGRRAEALLEDALTNGPIDDAAVPQRINAEAAFAILEHEQMHQETLLYMFHEMPYESKRARPPLTSSPSSAAQHIEPSSVRVPAGVATLGACDGDFAWDNETPPQRVEVESFRIDKHNVTNREYLDYMRSTGAPPPHFWARREGEWYWRGMFGLTELLLDAPVYAMQDEAAAFAKWRGQRLMTEAEYHRAAFGTPAGAERRYPWGDEPPDPTRGNFGFTNWDPVPVGSYARGASAWGVHDLAGNGWEWTATPFAGFPGFTPMSSYPLYSVDFFDGKHFVMKGASPATAPELVRRSFRNWFRPNYPYVYATFRCVW